MKSSLPRFSLMNTDFCFTSKKLCSNLRYIFFVYAVVAKIPFLGDTFIMSKGLLKVPSTNQVRILLKFTRGT